MTMRTVVTAGVAAVAVGLAACAGRLAGAGEAVQEYRGHLVSNGTLFRPCASEPGDSLWAVRFEREAVRQRERLAETGALELSRPLYVQVTAETSPVRPTEYMRLGTTREIYVQYVVAIRLMGDCDAGPAQAAPVQVAR